MNLMSNKWLLRFWANGEGIACGLSGRSWRVDVRVSIRNAWIGVRYTTFGPLSPSRAVTVQPLPCIGVVICWRPAAETQRRRDAETQRDRGTQMNDKRRIVRWRLNGYERLAQACMGGIVAAWAFGSQAAFAASALVGVIAALLARRAKE